MEKKRKRYTGVLDIYGRVREKSISLYLQCCLFKEFLYLYMISMFLSRPPMVQLQ